MEPFAMINKLTAVPGQRDLLLSYIMKMVELERALPGCDYFAVNTSNSEPDVIWTYEVFENSAAHDAFQKAILDLEGHAELREQATPLLSGPWVSNEMIQVGGKIGAS